MNLRTFTAVAIALASSATLVQQARGMAAGLGSSWPNVADLSSDTNLHVYRWVENGITYVQINERDGTPLMAVGAAAGTVFALPVGQARVTAIHTQNAAEAAIPVFADETISIMRKAGSFIVQPLAQPCNDAVQCSKPLKKNAPLKRSASAMKNPIMLRCDPIQCSKPPEVELSPQ